MGDYIDEWLVDLQGEGEQAGQALEKLYQEMYRPVFLLAASITNDTAMAEDAAPRGVPHPSQAGGAVHTGKQRPGLDFFHHPQRVPLSAANRSGGGA